MCQRTSASKPLSLISQNKNSPQGQELKMIPSAESETHRLIDVLVHQMGKENSHPNRHIAMPVLNGGEGGRGGVVACEHWQASKRILIKCGTLVVPR